MSGLSTILPIIVAVIAVVVALIFAVAIISAIRTSRTASSLSSQGQQTTGRVIAANAQTTGGGSDTPVRTRLVETIEFTTSDGRRIRGNPVSSDIGMLDRSGMDVTVLYDPQNPERFIAPKDGRAIAGNSAQPVIIAVVALFIIVVLGGFGWMFMNSMSMMSGPGF